MLGGNVRGRGLGGCPGGGRAPSSWPAFFFLPSVCLPCGPGRCRPPLWQACLQAAGCTFAMARRNPAKYHGHEWGLEGGVGASWLTCPAAVGAGGGGASLPSQRRVATPGGGTVENATGVCVFFCLVSSVLGSIPGCLPPSPRHSAGAATVPVALASSLCPTAHSDGKQSRETVWGGPRQLPTEQSRKGRCNPPPPPPLKRCAAAAAGVTHQRHLAGWLRGRRQTPGVVGFVAAHTLRVVKSAVGEGRLGRAACR